MRGVLAQCAHAPLQRAACERASLLGGPDCCAACVRVCAYVWWWVVGVIVIVCVCVCVCVHVRACVCEHLNPTRLSSAFAIFSHDRFPRLLSTTCQTSVCVRAPCHCLRVRWLVCRDPPPHASCMCAGWQPQGPSDLGGGMHAHARPPCMAHQHGRVRVGHAASHCVWGASPTVMCCAPPGRPERGGAGPHCPCCWGWRARRRHPPSTFNLPSGAL
jgi:hypothetical protein